jgi:hypothetical protein
MLKSSGMNICVLLLAGILGYFNDSPDRVRPFPIPEATDDEYYLDLLCIDPGAGWRGLELAHPNHLAWDMGSLDVRQWFTRIDLAGEVRRDNLMAGADIRRLWKLDDWSKDSDKTILVGGGAPISGVWGMVMLQPQFQKRYDEFALGAELRSYPFVLELVWAKPGFDNNYSFRLSSQNEGYEEMYRRTPFRLELNSRYTGYDWRFSLNMWRRFPYIKDFIDFSDKSHNLRAQWQETGVSYWNSWGDVEFPRLWLWGDWQAAEGGERRLEDVPVPEFYTVLHGWDAGVGAGWGQAFRLTATGFYRYETRRGESSAELYATVHPGLDANDLWRWDAIGMVRASWQLWKNLRFEVGLAAASINIYGGNGSQRIWWEDRLPLALEWKMFAGCRFRIFSGIDLNRNDWAELLFYDKAGANLLLEY